MSEHWWHKVPQPEEKYYRADRDSPDWAPSREVMGVFYDSGKRAAPKGWGVYECGYLMGTFPTREEARAKLREFIEYLRRG